MSAPRPKRLSLGNVDLDLPIFFPSVSSIKTNLPPVEYIKLLAALTAQNKQFLVSAYDLAHAEEADQEMILALLHKATDAGNIVLMDSGNYESYWHNTQAAWQQDHFHRTLQQFPSSLAFCFDEQSPPDNHDAHVKLVIERWGKDQAVATSTTLIPIIHGAPDDLPSLCREVAEISGVAMLAVPERRLGDGIFARAQTVKAIRQSLNNLGRYVGLHLLGTGNPLSIAIYSLAGADSYDGLEWCQTVVDYETGFLFHSTQVDFFKAQSKWDEMGVGFQTSTLAHNLDFYTDWLARLRSDIHHGNGVKFCRANFQPRIFAHCTEALGWKESSV